MKVISILIIILKINSYVSLKLKEEKNQIKTDKECFIENCVFPYGNCSENICICNNKYANIIISNGDSTLNNQLLCSYKKKLKYIALLGEIFIPIGFSYFYLGKISIGFLKVIICIISPLFIYCIGAIYFSFNSKKLYNINKILLIINIFIIFLWYIIDIILISTKIMTDVYGIELYS